MHSSHFVVLSQLFGLLTIYVQGVERNFESRILVQFWVTTKYEKSLGIGEYFILPCNVPSVAPMEYNLQCIFS